MLDSVSRLHGLFESSIDRARSIGPTASTTRLLLQLFALRFLSVTVEGLAAGARRGPSTPVREELEQLAIGVEARLPELRGVFTDQMIPSLRNADSLLPEWIQSVYEVGTLLKDSAPVFGKWFDSVVDSAAGGGGAGLQFATPRPVADLMLRLGGAGPGQSIHDACAGIGTLLAATIARHPQDAATMKLSGQEIDPGIAALARLRLFLLGARSVSIKVGDVLRQPQFIEYRTTAGQQVETFDLVLCDPPYGQRLGSIEFAQLDRHQRFRYGLPGRTSSDVAFLQHAIACTASEGCAVALTSHGPLFRSGGDAVVRANLVAADVIEAVIGLPFGSLPGLSIEPALILCRHSKRTPNKGRILFVDASERRDALRTPAAWRLFTEELSSIVADGRQVDGLARMTEAKEIADNNFSLQPRRYVFREEKRERLDISSLLSQAIRLEAEAFRQATEMDRLIAVLQPEQANVALPKAAQQRDARGEPGGAEKPAEKNPPSASSYSISDAVDGLFMEERQFHAVASLLRAKKNVILKGPPGVGKTFIARRLAYLLVGEKAPDRVQMVQFHPGYSYEDFVQGFRPTGQRGFRLKNGIFREFCERARQDPQRNHAFIIDEITRANLSSVFGEVMMLIEPDKRGPEWAIPLANSESDQDRFYVPENVYLIGLMNTTDRSIAMVDYALRRRFAFADLEPQFNSARFTAYLEGRGAPRSVLEALVVRMSSLNSEIARDLGASYCIGHGFFSSAPSGAAADWEGWFSQVVQSDIAPLLHEYYFDNLGRADQLLQELMRAS